MERIQLTLYIIIVVVLAVDAAIKETSRGLGYKCPNDCSNHGSCFIESVCVCDDGYKGADCSYKQCPYDYAFADKATELNTGHALAECSKQGLCDYDTGKCACFTGYTGDACELMVCDASNCNNNGECLTIGQVYKSYTNVGKNLDTAYSNWEAEKVTMCVCDAGVIGQSCGLKMCPKGDNPVTTSDGYTRLTVTITSSVAYSSLSGSLRIIYNGLSFTFSPVLSAYTNLKCRASFESLSNIETVTCVVTAVTSLQYTLLVTLVKFPVLPVENNIYSNDGTYSSGDYRCDTSLVTGAGTLSCVITDSTVATSPPEYAYCSNRGVCDFNSGACTCFSGYYGANCDSYNIDYAYTNASLPVDAMTLESTNAAYTSTLLSLGAAFATDSPSKYYALSLASNSEFSPSRGIFNVSGYGDVMSNTWTINTLDSFPVGVYVRKSGLDVTVGGVTIASDGFSFTSAEAVTGIYNNIHSDGLSATGTNRVTGGLTVYTDGISVYNGIITDALSVSTAGLYVIAGGVTVNGGGMTAVGGGTVTGGMAIVKRGMTVADAGMKVIGGMTIRAPVLLGAGITTSIDGIAITGGLTLFNSGLSVTGGMSVYSAGIYSPITSLYRSDGLVSTGTSAVSGLIVSNQVKVTGGASVFSDGIAVVGGFKSMSLGVRVTGGLSVETDGLKAVGGLTVSDTGVVVTAGGLTVVAGGVKVTGGMSIAGGLMVVAGTVTTLGGLTLTAASSANDALQGTTLQVTGGLSIVTTVGATVVASGISLAAGDASITGGLSALNSIMTCSGTAGVSSAVTSGGISTYDQLSFTGNVRTSSIDIDGASAISGLTASSGASAVSLSVQSGGIFITGGLSIVGDGFSVTAGGLRVGTGVVTIPFGVSVAEGMTVASKTTVDSTANVVLGTVSVTSSGLSVAGGMTITADKAVIGSGSLYASEAEVASVHAGGTLQVYDGMTVIDTGISLTGGLTILNNGIGVTGTVTVSTGMNVRGIFTNDLSVESGTVTINSFGLVAPYATVTSTGVSITGGLSIQRIGLSATGGLTLLNTGLYVLGGMTMGNGIVGVSNGVKVSNTGAAFAAATVSSLGLSVLTGLTVNSVGLSVTGGITANVGDASVDSCDVDGLTVRTYVSVDSGMLSAGGINCGSSVVSTNGLAINEDGLSIARRGMTISSNGLYLDTSLTVLGVAYFTPLPVTYSDRRLKQNISPIVNALSLTKLINGIYYHFNNESVSMSDFSHLDTSKRHIGLIAQNVQRVLPEVVSDISSSRNSSDRFLGVNYVEIVPLLVEAVREIGDKYNAYVTISNSSGSSGSSHSSSGDTIGIRSKRRKKLTLIKSIQELMARIDQVGKDVIRINRIIDLIELYNKSRQ